jgi:hypothetical protein
MRYIVMNRVMRGSVLLAAAIGLFACKGDPTDSLRNGVDHLVATPSALFVTYQGIDSIQNVLVEAVDAQGNRVETDFPGSITPNAAGITVTFDANYNPVFSGSNTPGQPSHTTRVQYIVQATANTGNSGFTVSAGGKNITIPVRIVPATVPSVTLSNAAPNLGDTVVATAPAFFKFTPASVVTLIGATNAIVGLAADSSTLSFVAGPGANGAVSISNLVLGYATTIATYTASSGAVLLTTPAAGNLTFTPASPAAGDTIVVTAPAPFRFTPTSVATVTGAGLSATGTGLGASTDSLTFRFLIGPNANANVSITKLVIAGAAAAGNYTLASTLPVITAAVPPITAVFSTTTPNVNDLVTVTAPAGIKFLPTAQVFFTNDQQTVTSVAADSNSLVFRAHIAGASGAISFGNAALSFLTNVAITVGSTNTATVGATINQIAGTDAIATAPLVVIPNTGNTGGIRDAGPFSAINECVNVFFGDNCRVYQFTISSTRTFAVSATWQGTTDMGIYFSNAGATALVGNFNCDSHGSGAGGQPEACTQTLTAGTYLMFVATFSSFYGPPDNVDPTDFTVALTGQ